MHINSPYNPGGNDGALDKLVNANIAISADYINVVGGIDERFDFPEDVYVHDYTGDIVAVPDPYEYLPPHDLVAIRALPDKGTIDDSSDLQTLSPGYYSGGIQISIAAITLAPGDYYLDSIGQAASMEVNGGLITGEGVTLHIIGDTDHGIEIQGNAMVDISAPASGEYEGIAIFQKRDPTYDCEQSCFETWSQSYPLSEFNGTGDIVLDGGVYMPHNRLELGGTGYIYMTRLVADRFYIYGTAEKIIDNGNPFAPWDLTENGAVDFDDLIFFCLQWGLEQPLSDIYIESNLNYDMNLDLSDFAIFAGHWLEVAE
jgi:hypothetical protein